MGDYGITFNVVLRIRNIVDEAVIKHEFIKKIYTVFKKRIFTAVRKTSGKQKGCRD